VRGRIDPFIVALLAAAAVASLVPAQGEWLAGLTVASRVAVALLFLLYGLRLSTGEALAGLRHWRLHITILSATFVLFPLLGLATYVLVPEVLPRSLYDGVLLLCLVPSTVQSSVAFTSIARGNVAGAVVSASLSNLLGVFLTPLLVALLLGAAGGARVNGGAILLVVALLLLPFVVGQVLRPLVARRRSTRLEGFRLFERGSILLVVYVAFSEGVNRDVWSGLEPVQLVVLGAVCVVLLGVVLALTAGLGRVLRFARGDRLALLFCGSHKSLATGLPMASVLFTSERVALVVVPLMLFHQLQLIVCAVIAGRASRPWGSRGSPATTRLTPSPIIDTPPAAPTASPRRRDRANQVRSWLAMSAHRLSDTSPMTKASRPSTSICSCTWPPVRSTNCGSTAPRIMNALGLVTPTTNPCRIARAADTGGPRSGS
jgi:sodium/bile acid cotransporter 7